MIRSDTAIRFKGRLRAAFLCAVWIGAAVAAGSGLSGCSASGNNPVVATLANFVPGRADVSARAKAVSYASIDLAVGGRGGLWILAEKSPGQTPGLTFWQSSRPEIVVLDQGYLKSTSGLRPELRMTDVHADLMDDETRPWLQPADSTLRYTLTRSWTTADGETDSGQADAKLACAARPVEKTLPLTTLSLQRCTETLSWKRGRVTRSVLWRDPRNHRIWAADVVAWPGSPRYSWRVARPWW